MARRRPARRARHDPRNASAGADPPNDAGFGGPSVLCPSRRRRAGSAPGTPARASAGASSWSRADTLPARSSTGAASETESRCHRSLFARVACTHPIVHSRSWDSVRRFANSRSWLGSLPDSVGPHPLEAAASSSARCGGGCWWSEVSERALELARRRLGQIVGLNPRATFSPDRRRSRGVSASSPRAATSRTRSRRQ